jgi:hypothetical protein
MAAIAGTGVVRDAGTPAVPFLEAKSVKFRIFLGVI